MPGTTHQRVAKAISILNREVDAAHTKFVAEADRRAKSMAWHIARDEGGGYCGLVGVSGDTKCISM